MPIVRKSTKIREGWIEFARYVLQTNELPAVFQALPASVAAAFGVTRHSPSATVGLGAKRPPPKIYNIDVIFAKEITTFSCAPYMKIAIPVRKR